MRPSPRAHSQCQAMTTDIPQTLLLATSGQFIYGCYVHSAILQTFHRRCYWLLQVSLSTAATSTQPYYRHSTDAATGYYRSVYLRLSTTSTQPYYRHSTDAATGYYRSVYLRLLRPLSHTTDIPQTLLLATTGQFIYGCYVHSAILQTFHRRCYWLLQVSLSTAATSTQPYYRHPTDAATGYYRSVYLRLLRPLSHTTDIPQTLLLATAGQFIYGCYVHSAILQTFHRRCYWLLQVSLSTAATSTQPYYVRHSTDAATGYYRSVYLWLLRPLSHTMSDIPQTLLLATAGQCIYGCYVHSAILQTFHRRCYWLLQVSVSTAATSTQLYYRHSTDAATGYCRSVYLWLLRPLSYTTDIPQTLLLATAGQCIYGCYVHSAILQTFHRRCYWLLQVSLSTAATSTQLYYRHSTDAATGYCRSVYLWLLRPLSHTTDRP